MKHYYNNGIKNIYVEEGTQPEGWVLGRHLKPRSAEAEATRKEKYKQTCLLRYGVEHNSQIPEFKEKIQKTKLDRYGDPNFCNLEKRHQTNLEKYGTEEVLSNKEIRKKCTDTLIQKYGVDNILKVGTVKEKQKNTFLERYGGFTMQSLELKEKVKSTLLEKYGQEYTFLIDEVQKKSEQTKIDKYNNPHFVNPEKAKSTNLEKYGVSNPAKLQETKDKMSATCLERYGVDSPFKSELIKEKSKQTCLERYGVEYSAQSEESKEKYKQTCLEKYGTEHYWQSDEYKKLLENRSPEEWQLIKQKEYETKRKNGTFNTSKPEDLYYEYLLSLYTEDDIIRQYSSEVYPFACDFYIKSKDLYIECNYNWTHGGHPFNSESVQDQQLLEDWKTKSENSDYYKNAIYTWTDLDVRKQQIARDNNLNYISLY